MDVQPGIAGAKPAKDISEITLLDVYRAVNAVQEDELFALHDKPNPDCPVGRNIQDSVEITFSAAQRALEKELESRTIKELTFPFLWYLKGTGIRTNRVILYWCERWLDILFIFPRIPNIRIL